MPEEIEIETKDLQETIEELHHERAEREEEAKKSAWTKYIAMSTAVLAVFAAIGALQGGAKVNEAMILQIRASDKWNEYQSARQKDHLYTLKANDLLDAGAALEVAKEKATSEDGAKPKHEAKPDVGGHATSGKSEKKDHGKSPEAKPVKKKSWKSLAANARLAQYIEKVDSEAEKEVELKKEAEKLEKESESEMHHHHRFAYAVAMIQVAIALSAIAALTRIKNVWFVSVMLGLVGIGFFFIGLLGK